MSRDALSHAETNTNTTITEAESGFANGPAAIFPEPRASLSSATNANAAMNVSSQQETANANAQYRSRPVAVAVDPVSLVISECISVTSVMRKHARWAHSSVSSILGGSPNSVQLGPSNPLLRPKSKASAANLSVDGALDVGVANRWGLRGQKGKSMADNPLMAGFGRLRHELSSCKGKFEARKDVLLLSHEVVHRLY